MLVAGEGALWHTLCLRTVCAVQLTAMGERHGQVAADTAAVPHAAACAQLVSAGGEVKQETACHLECCDHCDFHTETCTLVELSGCLL